ncbi:lengsin [Corythoichthys intestinalis]|uniref:lengsin n=1 Tax=Corythoichthys intestinalis TaxID=161448 RepID=UPI0025A50DCF|nr:lengsin [Corythoichthys intestinalis]XP_057700090.1 lengsin [Corythoichthys intestinalis]XP_061791374.1 lengsin [Nerophis lumbriciformis]
MNDCEDSKATTPCFIDSILRFKGPNKSQDQMDGTGMSVRSRKGVRVTGRYTSPIEWVGGPNKPPDSPIIGSPPKGFDKSGLDRPAAGGDLIWGPQNKSPHRQTVEELKSFLKDGPAFQPGGSSHSCLHGGGVSGDGPGKWQVDVSSQRAFSTFKPQSDASRKGPGSRESSSIQLPPTMDSSSSFRPDANTNRQPEFPIRTCNSSASRGETKAPHTDNGNESLDTSENQSFISSMETIKQQIARENINFVRFEATDLHGVSRSKTVPVRFFHEKAVYGIPMPRSYLELTLSPKSNEVDHANAANFSSDILLIPDLSTFRILPWAEQTARVICDPCTVTGGPLRTSPRLLAKQLLGQLQSLGFSLHSSFTYECCVLGAPDRIGPKTLLFPATTLLGNHDLPFFQQLVDGMYCMGADVDSMASASGPGQMEINLRPEFGIAAADSAFTFRTGIKELARKHSYIASFFTDDGLYNAGVLSHSLWDVNGRRSLFQSGEKAAGELSDIGRKWLAGLLTHSAALSCLMSPGLECRSHMAKTVKDPKRMLYATYGCNDNSSSFNVKSHGGRETHIDNKLGSAMANPYIVLAATAAAGLDGIRRNLSIEGSIHKAPSQQKDFAIPVKLDDALEALSEDHVIRSSLGEPFVQYFIAMKKFEIETQELDDERNKCLEYFI